MLNRSVVVSWSSLLVLLIRSECTTEVRKKGTKSSQTCFCLFFVSYFYGIYSHVVCMPNEKKNRMELLHGFCVSCYSPVNLTQSNWGVSAMIPDLFVILTNGQYHAFFYIDLSEWCQNLLNKKALISWSIAN